MDQEHREKLLNGKKASDLSLEEINALPYLDTPLANDYSSGQEKILDETNVCIL